MRTIAALALTALLLPPAAFAQEPSAVPPVPIIVTTGEATVKRAPDQAFVTAAVETRAKDPKEAQRLNAAAMTAVQARVRSLGVPGNTIRTTGYSIQQQFDFTNGRRIPRDYLATNGVEIRLDDVERTGEILDAVVAAGATNVGGVRFDLKDRAAVEREVLKLAVENARERAEAMASGAGRSVDRVLKVEDSRAPRPYAPQPMMRMAAADAAPTPIEAGLVEVHAQVTLTVGIK